VTALIETVRVVGGRAPLWKLHLARLRDAAAALKLNLQVPPAPSGGPDRVVRYELRGAETTVTTRDPSIPAALRLHVSAVSHQPYPWKTTDRAIFERALAEAEDAGADDALLLSDGGPVREATRWAVVWRREDGTIGAPPLASGVLRSVARARLGELPGVVIVEEETGLGELMERPVAAVNAARGVVPVAFPGGVAPPFWSGWSALASAFWS
jgi:branched-subunit amino acid aminotransferase/4-amino-4-deoxychorismate lyase